jgi:tetratricopeptide (TPR) repeat protein
MAANILIDNAAKLKGQPRREMLEKALRHIIAIIRTDDSNAKAFYKAGEVLLSIAEVTKTLPSSSTSGNQNDRATEAKAFERGARKAFERTIELDPNMAEAYLGLARVLSAENDAAGAKTQIEKYLKLAPQGPGAEEAKKILKTLK